MKNSVKIRLVLYLFIGLISNQFLAAFPTSDLKNQIPAVNPQISPLAEANRQLLLKRIVATFDYKYKLHRTKNHHKNLGDRVYYLRRELQALIDMWRATDNPVYLDRAEKLVFKAIADAQASPRTLLRHGQSRGTWPCFFLESVSKQTGGHNQICDFQGAAGFLMVADAMHQANKPNYKEIIQFIESNIIEKWLFYNPLTKPENFHGPKSNMYLLLALDSARDKREYFAVVCMDLYKLGLRKYPYKQWAQFLTDIYLGNRANLAQPYPKAHELGKHAPNDWGVIPNKKTGGFVWYWTKNIIVQDTSHANRTVWLATKAYHENLINQTKLNGFIETLKQQVWAPEKGPFHFNNFIDGRDTAAKHMVPGQKGNVWFGWHRLAAYDETLRDLFVSMAYDLTNDGPNITKGSQNKTMENAPLCFLAWGARLLSTNGQPLNFP